MNPIVDLDDFNERAQDVSNYFYFLRDLEQGTILLSRGDAISPIDSELDKTLKATGFLLLYNLIESTMRNAIQTIFDDISNRNVSFETLRPKIKQVILTNLKKNIQQCNINNIEEQIQTIHQNIVQFAFNPNDLFSGNVDAKEIKRIAEIYGFSTITDTDTRDGIDLLSIKKNRNDLAHGVISFKEVGQNTSAENLVEISERVIKYLRQILENIDRYLIHQEYLDSNTQ